MRAVLDTNVIVSGLLFGGLPLKILLAAINGEFTFVTSQPLIEELETVLTSKKFGLTLREIEDATQSLVEAAEIVYPEEHVTVIKRCVADNFVLGCALAGNCDAIVTGDKQDLLRLGSFHGIPILSPRSFVSEWLK
ncbi:MAG: putative toxin-antitoxin system toxin component, PIN family [Deltaproteobacteria bacterium]|nr:putative toxin-antitoxin system toxin component, PIN family [Deltaproteobacteria bacterium]